MPDFNYDTTTRAADDWVKGKTNFRDDFILTRKEQYEEEAAIKAQILKDIEIVDTALNQVWGSFFQTYEAYTKAYGADLATLQEESMKGLSALQQKEAAGPLTEKELDLKAYFQDSMEFVYKEAGNFTTIIGRAFKNTLTEESFNNIRSEMEKLGREGSSLKEKFEGLSKSTDPGALQAYTEALVGGKDVYDLLKISADAYGLSVEQLIIGLSELSDVQSYIDFRALADGAAAVLAPVKTEAEKQFGRRKGEISAISAARAATESGKYLTDEELLAFNTALEKTPLEGYSMAAWNALKYKPVEQQREFIEGYENAYLTADKANIESLRESTATAWWEKNRDIGEIEKRIEESNKQLDEDSPGGALSNRAQIKKQKEADEVLLATRQAEKEALEAQSKALNPQDGLFEDRMSMILAYVDSLDELNDKLGQGAITEKEYAAAKDYVIAKEAEQLGVTKEYINTLKELYNLSDEEVLIKIKIDQGKEAFSDLRESVQQLFKDIKIETPEESTTIFEEAEAAAVAIAAAEAELAEKKPELDDAMNAGLLEDGDSLSLWRAKEAENELAMLENARVMAGEMNPTMAEWLTSEQVAIIDQIRVGLSEIFGLEPDAIPLDSLLHPEYLKYLQEGMDGNIASLKKFAETFAEIAELMGTPIDPNSIMRLFFDFDMADTLEDLERMRQYQNELGFTDEQYNVAHHEKAKEEATALGISDEDFEAAVESAMGEIPEKYKGNFDGKLVELTDTGDFTGVIDALETVELSEERIRQEAEQWVISSAKLTKSREEAKEALNNYNKVLKKNKDAEDESAEAKEEEGRALNKLKKQVKELFGLDLAEDYFNPLTEEGKLLEKALNGDTAAMAEFAKMAGQAATEGADKIVGKDGFASQLQASIDGLDLTAPTITVDSQLNAGGFIDGLNQLYAMGDEGVAKANEILAGIQYDPIVEPVPAEGGWETKIDGKATTDMGTIFEIHGGAKNETVMTVPKIVGLKKKDGNTTVTNPSKGGGGGGGKQTKKPKSKKPVESKKDPFHDVNIRIKNLATDLERLDKAREKLVGKDLTKNLNEQLEIIKQQIAAEKEKIAIAEREAALKREELAKEGVKFGADGQITNYFDIIDEKEKELNRMIDKYNGMSAESQEEFEEKINEAEDAYDKFLETLEEYEELINDTIPESEDKIQEAIDKQIEIQVDKFKMAVELRLETSEAEREWNEFKSKVINDINEDNTIATARVRLQDYLSYYNTGNTGVGSIQALSEQVQNTIKELNEISATGWSDVYGDNQAQAIEDLKEYTDQLKDQLMEIEDIVDEVNEAYYDVIDEVKEDFDKQIEQYEHVSDLIQHDMEVIKLLYGEDEYGAMASFFERQMETNNAQLDSLRRQAEFWRDQMNNAEVGSEAWDLFRENYEETVSELNDSLEDALDTIVEKYVNSINQIFDELNDKLSNGTGLDYMKDEWDLINKNADEYLDAINAAYGIHEVEAKFMDAINDTDSISTQQRLNQLMKEQLDDLRERDKLTEYDVERAERMLDIELKRIALEEAQQNKTKLRLRRDSQGNYSYQYVTDEDAVREAQDELAAAQNDLYNFDKDRYKENLNSMYATYKEFQEKMLELYEDQTLSDKERERKKALLIEQYGELINGKTEQNTQIRINLEQSAFDELAALYDRNVEEFQNMTDAEKDILMIDLIPAWSSGVQEMIDTFIAEGGFIPACIEAFEKLGQAVDGYKEDIKDVEDVGDMNAGDLKNGVDDLIDSTNELITNNDKLLESANQELEAIQSIIAELEKMIAKYQEAKDAAIDAVNAGYNSWGGNKTNSAIAAESDSGTGSGAAASATGSKNFNLEPEIGDKVKFTSGSYYSSPDADEALGSMGLGEYVEIVRVEEDAAKPYQVAIDNEILGWLDKNQISAFDTGGYTGEWGSDGKLALLHQKELILNASDTANILNAVEVMRDISNMLDASMMNRILGMMSGVGATLGAINRDTDTIEQNVHIEASFPSVTNSNEIQDALNNLVNIAAQRSMSQLR